ncbi:phospholipid methyltransferase [Bradyrhizobium sp. Gha]|uniref:class I SAM-dependent methyltransferase n=1 Tax=Bradyrhizobium sp. Gha TaxID=1855318 RepID=UPI0008E9B40C|nr:phospholipid methyltransferase [Bradyrhizobium sp. Gha]SFI01975.1 Phospholipid N-methyltransferase [Bradyrhizobium sp. Gha]
MSNTFLFFRALASNPLMVGAIAPSGPVLADLITREVDPSDGPVLELGPGTGVFTEALLARGVRQTDLTLIESGSDFARVLRLRFPEARVLRMDAARLGVSRLLGNASLGCAISGLPLLNMSARKVTAILIGVFSLLRNGGALYQFTYGVRCPVPRRLLDRLGLKASLHGRVLRNFPPAQVYKIVRRKRLTSREGGI